MVINSTDDVFFADEDDGVVKEIDPPYTGVTRTIAAAATNIAIDKSDHLWIPVSGPTGPYIEELAAPYTGAPLVTISNSTPGTKLGDPTGIGITSDGHVAVLDLFSPIGGTLVDVFAPPYTGAPQVLGTDVPGGLNQGRFEDSVAVDSAGPIYALTASGLTVDQWMAPYTGGAQFEAGGFSAPADSLFISP